MKLTWADFNGACRPSGTEVNYQTCPACKDERWHFYVSTKTGGYHCFKCGFSGYAALGAEQVVARWEDQPEPEWRPIDLPSTAPLGPEAERYLAERNVDPQYARIVLGLSDWPERKRIVIPYRNETGAPIYWVARSYTGADPKYLKPPGRQPLYVVSHSLVPQDTVVVVEGVFDAWAVDLLGYKAVALVAKTLPRHLEQSMWDLILPRQRVLVCLDGDALADGMKLAAHLAQRHNNVSQIVLESGQDPASMDSLALWKQLRA